SRDLANPRHWPVLQSLHLPACTGARLALLRSRDGSACRARRHAMTIKIVANDKGNPPGKLADAELHFTDGPLAGLKLIGFAVWERRANAGGYNVTFPARTYSMNGERRTFALLRPIVDTTAQNQIRELILQAYQEYEDREAVAR